MFYGQNGPNLIETFNSIVAGPCSLSGNEDSTFINSRGFTLVEGLCDIIEVGNIGTNWQNVSAGLLLLDGNATIPTQALDSDSHAIDRGSCPDDLRFDQRGEPRVIDQTWRENADNGCDIGAFELESQPQTAVTLRDVTVSAEFSPILIITILIASALTIPLFRFRVISK